MASLIASIYDAIQAMDVSVDSVVIPVENLARHKGFVNQTPKRILAPLTTEDDARAIQPMTFGGRITMTWRITDMMLWAKVEQGSGLQYHVPKLVAYSGAYVDAFTTQLATDRHLGLGKNVSVENITGIEIGVYEYPAASGQWYYGCLSAWRITENL